MASGLSAGLLASILLLSVGSSVQGQGGSEQGRRRPGEPRPPGQPGGHGPPEHPGDCYVHPHEILCLHITLELILKTAISEYVSSNPEIQSRAPWFDSFKHVNIPPGAFTSTSLSLLSNIDIRESLTFCTETGGSHNGSIYIPPSPVQMYKDMCSENAAIQSQIQ